MKKRIFFVVEVCLFLLISIISFSKKYTADEIINITLEITELDGAEAITRLVIKDNKGNEKERRLAQVSKLYKEEGITKKLMRFIAPADVKGTGFLTYDYDSSKDNDQWLYLPSLRKVRKIVSSEKGNSFMGSEFTYADISRLKKKDFNFKILSEKTVNNEFCWEIEETPVSEDKEDEYGFLRKVVYISQKDFVIRKAIIYDFDDKPFKELNIKKVEKIDFEKNKFRPTHLIIKNLENGRISEMIIDKLMLNRNVKDDYFSFRYLKRN